MGLDNIIEKTKARVTMMNIKKTSFQFVPEKLPKDQLCKFTMLESLAKVTIKSVIAEKM